MSVLEGFRPTAAEETQLRFSFGSAGVDRRLLWAAGLFALGMTAWGLLALPFAVLGLLLVLWGHGVIWVQSQTTTPGGATPRHEEIWVPVEEDWLERVRRHERRGAAWDASPFDLSNLRGCGVLLLLTVVTAVAGLTIFALTGADPGGFELAARWSVGMAFLLIPLWLNGMRTTWNPSELKKKGEALEAALAAFRSLDGEASGLEVVPMLALREGERGKYPVDAKLMLRPASEDDSGFLGIQVQVAMNNVQGTDYPYLYAVVLGRGGFRPPEPGQVRPGRAGGRKMVFEAGQDHEVRFLVIRQHADRKGGWHTEETTIRALVAKALEVGADTWKANRP